MFGLAARIERARYALACDDEANAHYQVSPSFWFRLKLVVMALSHSQ